MSRVFLIWTILVLIGMLANAQDVSNPMPQSGGPYPVGKGVSPPTLVSKTEPDYTDEARDARVESTVVARLVVSADGSPINIRVVRGAGFGLDENAVETIKTWRFKPGMKEGQPVAVIASVAVNFRLLNKDHEDQTARLNFTLQQGASRPELRSGEIPTNPSASGDQYIRVRMQLTADGKPRMLTVLDSTDQKWEQAVLRKLNSWRFYPSKLQGNAVEAEGVFELTHGRERRPAPTPK
jgi:TonB family protein